MCCSKHTIRILDMGGEVLWQDSHQLHGKIRIAFADSDEDMLHEIYLRIDDHGTIRQLHIKPFFKPQKPRDFKLEEAEETGPKPKGHGKPE